MYYLKRRSSEVKSIIIHPILLITGLLLLYNACMFSKSSEKPVFSQGFPEKLSLRDAYRASLRILNLKGYQCEGYLDNKEGLITTDWFYFYTETKDWKFRYKLDLRIFRNEGGYIEVSLNPEYEGGYLLRADPFTPNPVGYVWKRRKVDESLKNRIDAFFTDLGKNIYPIKSKIYIDSARLMKYARYKISGLIPDIQQTFPIDDMRQKLVQKHSDYVVIDMGARILDKENNLRTPPELNSQQKYLLPTNLCPVDNKKIRSLALKLRGEDPAQGRWVVSIAEWIHNRMTPIEGIGIISAPEVLEGLKGDCTEYTVLMVSLCRTLGIPARAALGAMYIDGGFEFHMWTEVYLGHWQEIDPMWLSVDPETGGYFVDATHIKFRDVSLNDATSQEINQTLMPILGEIEIQILGSH